MARSNASGISAAIAGRVHRLALLFAVMLAILPASSLVAAAHGYDGHEVRHARQAHGAIGRAGRPDAPLHQSLMRSTAADIAANAAGGCAPDHGAAVDGACCAACQAAFGLVATPVEPVSSPRATRIARTAEVTPPGEPASAPTEPPRS